MEDVTLKKIEVGVGELNVRFDNLEKRFDSLEKEIHSYREESVKNSERIIRLEEAGKNLLKDFERSEARRNAELEQNEHHICEKVDKKLLQLKLALLTSFGAIALTIAKYVFDFLKR
ncbi:MAG: hypothetical protein FWH53_00765 [Leptospirales bacterium]|nr:hypothetical protein [Leptospirales bacterium]